MKKILVIEDEPDIRLHILTILQYEGFTPIGAKNGQIGLKLAKAHRPDLIICDILMPDLSGYGVLARLRSDPITANIPFIFLTAKATPEDFRQGMKLGADDYLTKPFRSNELLAAIQTRLKKQAAVSKQMENLRLNLSALLPQDLWTPLKEITSFSEFLKDVDVLPERGEIAEIGKIIYANSSRLRRRVENYLIYADLMLSDYNPEKRQEWQEVENIDTKPFIRFFASYQAEKVHRSRDLMLELADARLRISPKILQKIVMELFNNAFKFSKSQTIVHAVTSVDGDQFFLKITDYGQGMTLEQIANLEASMHFKRYWYEYQGSGLGLIICCLLTQLHGGELTIESGLHKQTTVTVVLNRND
jgi:two-component system sensor histidine kinase/response regulator